MKTIFTCAVAIALIAGVGVLWPNDTNVCNVKPPSFSGTVEAAARETVQNTERCWILRVRDPQTGTLYRVPFETEAETLKYPVGSTYSR